MWYRARARAYTGYYFKIEIPRRETKQKKIAKNQVNTDK